MQANRTLTQLSLRLNELEADGAAVIGDALKAIAVSAAMLATACR